MLVSPCAGMATGCGSIYIISGPVLIFTTLASPTSQMASGLAGDAVRVTFEPVSAEHPLDHARNLLCGLPRCGHPELAGT